MGRSIEKLTALKVKQKAKEPGIHGDGGGLWLYTSAPTAAGAPPASSWVFRFSAPRPFMPKRQRIRGVAPQERPAGSHREMGLGSYPAISLLEARTKAAELRKLVAAGHDPITQREAIRAEESRKAASTITFAQAAERYMSLRQADPETAWRNPKHAAQWSSTLQTYALPFLAAVPVASVNKPLLVQIFEQQVRAQGKHSAGPLWAARSETAERLRQRIEKILAWAEGADLRTGENPARSSVLKGSTGVFPGWKDKAVRHHAAIPHDRIGEFCARLRQSESISAQALDFTILTVARTGETLGACGREIDILRAVWVVPGPRMKSGREHRVPLSAPAVEIAKRRIAISGDGFLFPGLRAGKPLCNMAMSKVMSVIGYGDFTVHGCRSAFRDWAGDCTNFQREVIEAALAHTVGDQAEQAYRRGDALAKRRELMDAWARYCSAPAPATNVIDLQTGAARA